MAPRRARQRGGGQGVLVADSGSLPFLGLPRATPRRISEPGEPMRRSRDGIVPYVLDGMAASAGGNCVRHMGNHEICDGADVWPPLSGELWDAKAPTRTTALEVNVDTVTGDLAVHVKFVSIGGTAVNRIAGPTPWGTWISCGETTSGRSQDYDRKHSYRFSHLPPPRTHRGAHLRRQASAGRPTYRKRAVPNRAGPPPVCQLPRQSAPRYYLIISTWAQGVCPAVAPRAASPPP